ncbi:hypothetical protein TH63_03620 [Rufibacter radiotolerans]|uniref:Uncharacterized protein n=1 Tax=Rufibacter radiotolerans TaxID=1379910 RepID=A0A0H4VHU5_9BACT|nr:hypothetical protein TH63_03620 [Rufibacter radiotolerans]
MEGLNAFFSDSAEAFKAKPLPYNQSTCQKPKQEVIANLNLINLLIINHLQSIIFINFSSHFAQIRF